MDAVASRPIGSISSGPTHQFSFDWNRIAEEIKNWAVGVNHRGQFLIASRILWPALIDVDANRIEAGPSTVVDAEEPAQINVTVDADLNLVELDAKLGRPDPISNRLTRTQRRQGIFHGVLQPRSGLPRPRAHQL
jgi:hypothetical protein